VPRSRDRNAEEARELARAAGDEEGAAQAMGILADVVAFRGDLATAGALYEEAAELARLRGDRLELAITLYSLGYVARLQGKLQAAEDRFEESLTISRELGDVMGQAAALQSLVDIASDAGDHARALSLLRESTELLESIRYVSGLLESLNTHAGLLTKLGEADAAARLWGAFQVLAAEVGRDAAHPLEAAARDENVAAAREALGGEAFERAWVEGGSLSLDDAVAFALERGALAADRV
jgi:tetratricopeptide (TPR) repeat protein